MMLPVAILAGGLATRLRPMTDRVPKSLLSIAGRPFIFHQLELLKNQGIDRVVLCVGHLGDQVKAAVGDGRALGLAIDYSFDGGELLGTGGALKRALSLLGDKFFVLHGDSYLPCSFAPIQSAYEAARRPALMTVLRNDNHWDKSNVLFRSNLRASICRISTSAYTFFPAMFF
jgi:NDP-sugar pyrophosphorylase family protein